MMSQQIERNNLLENKKARRIPEKLISLYFRKFKKLNLKYSFFITKMLFEIFDAEFGVYFV